jgi:hypothetical protein
MFRNKESRVTPLVEAALDTSSHNVYNLSSSGTNSDATPEARTAISALLSQSVVQSWQPRADTSQVPNTVVAEEGQNLMEEPIVTTWQYPR